jgi:outer membrane biosynthesis protein TonB
MQANWREYSPAVVFSIGLHVAMVVAVLLAARLSLHRTPEIIKPLALDAVVIDSRSLRPSAPAPAPAPAPAAAVTPPAPTPPREPPVKAQAQAAEVQAAEQARRVVQAQKLADEQKAAAQKAAEAQRQLDAQRAADEKKAADARAKADREAELRRQMAAEEHVQAVESGPLSASYYAMLQARITHSWIKPSSAGPGIDCRVEVTQVPGGEIVGARVTQCNGDAAVRQSIENAIYRASPLPDPPDPALFHRVFTFEFKPDE